MAPDRRDPKRHREERMRSNPTRSAILNLLERRPETETTVTEVWDVLRADASLRAVGYHLTVLAANGLIKQDDSQTEPCFQLAS